MWPLGTKNHRAPLPAPAGLSGEKTLVLVVKSPLKGWGARWGNREGALCGTPDPSGSGSSQCQYWGKLGCPTPLGDQCCSLGPQNVALQSCCCGVAEAGRGQDAGPHSCCHEETWDPHPIPAPQGWAPPSSPSLAGIAPGGHERWPQRSSAPLAGRAQWHQPAAGTEEWLSLPAPERGAPTCAAQPRRSRAGLGTGWVDPARALMALAITTAECQGGRGRCPRCPSLVWTHSALEGLGSPGPQG